MDIRLLKASEIECRIGTFKENSGMSLLLYKDARVDQRILDESVGASNWKREHIVSGTPIIVTETDKYNKTKQVIKGQFFSCIVSIWDEDKKQWIGKEDTGNESNTDEIKGLYSDSFKRACVNWGIGRELYTSPFIWIPSNKGYNKYEKFKVKEIGYNDEREIDFLVIVDSKGKEAFRFGGSKKDSRSSDVANDRRLLNKEEKERLFMTAKGLETPIVKEILGDFGFDNSSQVTSHRLDDLCKVLENAKNVDSKFRGKVVKELIEDTRNI